MERSFPPKDERGAGGVDDSEIGPVDECKGGHSGCHFDPQCPSPRWIRFGTSGDPMMDQVQDPLEAQPSLERQGLEPIRKRHVIHSNLANGPDAKGMTTKLQDRSVTRTA